ncbi:MAG: ferrous iron transport protein A [Clostridia bacterium]|nr:ferrous iron transport protein A [Clostridia bacterium]
MTMNDLRRGDRAVVLKVELPVLLKERLRSLGIFTGAKLKLLKGSPKRGTWLLQVGSAHVALDGETAAGIKLWKI